MTTTTDQITGPLRSLIPGLTGIIVGFGMDDVTAGLIAYGVLSLCAAAWSWFSNRPASLATELVKQPDVVVEVGPSAPEELQAVVADHSVPRVVEKKRPTR